MVLFGGACMVFSVFFGYNEIRSMSGRYASYWNAFLFIETLVFASLFQLFLHNENTLNNPVQLNYCYKYHTVDLVRIIFQLCMQIPSMG